MWQFLQHRSFAQMTAVGASRLALRVSAKVGSPSYSGRSPHADGAALHAPQPTFNRRKPKVVAEWKARQPSTLEDGGSAP
jgi:hypothetical protein